LIGTVIAMNDFDLASRRMAKSAPVAFFQWLMTSFSTYLHFNRWEDTRTIPFPGNPERTGDSIAVLEEIQTPGPPWIMPIEFQLEPDPQMFGRMLVFLGLIWQEKRPDPLPGSRYHLAAAVVNLTGSSSGRPTSHDMMLPGPDGLRCCLLIRERFLLEESAPQLLSEIRNGRQSRWMLPFIPLMKVDDNTDIVASWLEEWNLESDERIKSEILVLTRVFMYLSESVGNWKKALEGLNVQKSPFLESIRAEGRVADRIESILETLRQKFPNELDPGLINAVEQTHELDRLRQWFQIALNATSMDGFRQASGI
jgi:hypothetical protein